MQAHSAPHAVKSVTTYCHNVYTGYDPNVETALHETAKQVKRKSVGKEIDRLCEIRRSFGRTLGKAGSARVDRKIDDKDGTRYQTIARLFVFRARVSGQPGNTPNRFFMAAGFRVGCESARQA